MTAAAGNPHVYLIMHYLQICLMLRRQNWVGERDIYIYIWHIYIYGDVYGQVAVSVPGDAVAGIVATPEIEDVPLLMQVGDRDLGFSRLSETSGAWGLCLVVGKLEEEEDGRVKPSTLSGVPWGF